MITTKCIQQSPNCSMAGHSTPNTLNVHAYQLPTRSYLNNRKSAGKDGPGLSIMDAEGRTMSLGKSNKMISVMPKNSQDLNLGLVRLQSLSSQETLFSVT